MQRELAPDENLRWENWNDTINYIKGRISKAEVLSGPAKEQFLRDARNALAGVPDAHPEKPELLKKLR